MADIINELVLSEVYKAYGSPSGSVEILRGVDLRVMPGETLAIVGPSGSGKSTLLHLIGALDRPDSGRVMMGDIDVVSLSGRALSNYRAAAVGFVFQEHHLLPQLTARENVLLPRLALSAIGNDSDADILLEAVGIASRAEAFPAQMSGGERQRAAIARAMINSPRLLLCDEPTGNLDGETGANVISLLLDIAEKKSVAAIMVTHNREHAARFSRIMHLRDGRLLDGLL